MLGELARGVAPAVGTQAPVSGDGILPKIIGQRDQLLNVLRQGLYQQHPGVSDRATAMVTG
jgi:hypothetical protein